MHNGAPETGGKKEPNKKEPISHEVKADMSKRFISMMFDVDFQPADIIEVLTGSLAAFIYSDAVVSKKTAPRMHYGVDLVVELLKDNIAKLQAQEPHELEP